MQVNQFFDPEAARRFWAGHYEAIPDYKLASFLEDMSETHLFKEVNTKKAPEGAFFVW